MSAQPFTADDGWWIPVSDKVAHLGVYAVFGATLAHARWHGTPELPHWALVLLGALFAASDEWHQSFVPGRTPSGTDWIADVGGIVVGYTLAWLIASSLLRDGPEPEEPTT